MGSLEIEKAQIDPQSKLMVEIEKPMPKSTLRAWVEIGPFNATLHTNHRTAWYNIPNMYIPG